MEKFLTSLPDRALTIGQQLVGAILVYLVGRWLISMVVRLIAGGMSRRHVDQTLANYAVSTITGVLNVVLFVSILGTLGIQTATFAALFAGLGIAIGTMTGGLLGNFAAGVFLMVLRPFRVGDFITAGGVTGTVTEIGPFATRINTPDNVHTVVGNNKIFADNIQNFSHNPYRRVELSRHLAGDLDLVAFTSEMRERLLAIPHVLSEPAPDIEILEFRPGGPLVAIRPYCHNEHYWQVYFDSNRAIQVYCDEKKLAPPEQAIVVRQSK